MSWSTGSVTIRTPINARGANGGYLSGFERSVTLGYLPWLTRLGVSSCDSKGDSVS